MIAQTQTTLLIYIHVKALWNMSTAVEFFNSLLMWDGSEYDTYVCGLVQTQANMIVGFPASSAARRAHTSPRSFRWFYMVLTLNVCQTYYDMSYDVLFITTAQSLLIRNA